MPQSKPRLNRRMPEPRPVYLASASVRRYSGDWLDRRVHIASPPPDWLERPPKAFVQFDTLCGRETRPDLDEDCLVSVEPDDRVPDCLDCRRELWRYGEVARA